MLFLIVLSLCVAGTWSMECPGSPAAVHASCQIYLIFNNSCDEVRTEISSRVNGQYSQWYGDIYIFLFQCFFTLLLLMIF
jgi:hypothetical protein